MSFVAKDFQRLGQRGKMAARPSRNTGVSAGHLKQWAKENAAEIENAIQI